MRNHTSDLIQYYLGRCPGQISLEFENADVTRLISSGLGPIAHWAMRERAAAAPGNAETQLCGADLTARVLHTQLRRSIREILDLLRKEDLVPVLLKGASLADQIYREPHHRIMGDVDLLVHKREAPHVAALLQSSGYLPVCSTGRKPLPDNHHHLPELRKESTRVSVEIHTHLFSRGSHSRLYLHQSKSFWQETRESEFDGVCCLRLRPEYEIAYGMTHWAIDRRWSENAVNFFDIALLINTFSDVLDWQKLVKWMDDHPQFNEVATATIGYLDHRGLIDAPRPIANRVRHSLRKLGRWNTDFLYWLISNFPLGAGSVPKGRFLTPSNAQIAWREMLEPRPSMARIPIASARVLTHRKEGESFFGSLISRLRTLLAPRR